MGRVWILHVWNFYLVCIMLWIAYVTWNNDRCGLFQDVFLFFIFKERYFYFYRFFCILLFLHLDWIWCNQSSIIAYLCNIYMEYILYSCAVNLMGCCYNAKVLEGVIKYRWNVLPVEQRDGIKNYISDLIVQVL